MAEVALEAAVADLHVAGEGWPPALLEDRSVEPLDVAVGLGAAGPDAGVAGVELFELGGEARLVELVA